MRRKFECILLCHVVAAVALPEEPIKITTNVEDDPLNAVFVYDDLHVFLRVDGALASAEDGVATLQAEYFDRGTKGLAKFVEKYDLSAQRLADAIAKRREEYASLPKLLPWLMAQEAPAREAFGRLKQLMPQVVFPPTYYLVGDYQGIASGSPEGQLISVERFDPQKTRLATLIVHELVHFQQLRAQGPDEYYAVFGSKKTLLALTVREGAAEFFADRVTGRITQEQAREYVLKHEADLWRRFQAEMNGSETGDWMWKKPSDPDQPKDVAYMLGSRIVASYYDRAEDKERAVQEILSVTDYPAFLEGSGWAQQFTGK